MKGFNFDSILFRSSIMFLIRVSGYFVSFGMVFFVSGTMNAHDAGSFLVSFMLITLIGSLLTFGSNSAIVKLVACSDVSDVSDWRDINLNVSSLTLSIVLIVFILLLLFFLSDKFIYDTNVSIFVIVGAFFFSINQVYSASLLGVGKTISSALCQNLIPNLWFVIFVCVAYLNDALVVSSLVHAFIFSLLLGMLVTMFFWFKLSGAMFIAKIKFSPQFLSSIKALFVVVLLQMVVEWSTQITVSTFLSASEFAIFSNALKIAMLSSFFAISVGVFLSPKIASNYSKGNINAINLLCLRGGRISVLVSTPIFLLLWCYPGFILSVLGDEYLHGIPVIKVLLLGQFCIVLSHTVGFLLIMTGHELLFKKIMLFSSVISMLSSIALTLNFGLLGAAWAQVMSVVVLNIACAFQVNKVLSFNVLNIFRVVRYD